MGNRLSGFGDIHQGGVEARSGFDGTEFFHR
jgi:hypothetical protein